MLGTYSSNGEYIPIFKKNKKSPSLSITLLYNYKRNDDSESTTSTGMTDHLKYVTKVPHNYKPRIFGTTEQINKILQQKTLVNLSSHILSPAQTEALTAGLK